MKRFRKEFILLSCLFVMTGHYVFGQGEQKVSASDTIYVVETTDGNRFTGKIIEMDKEKVVMELGDKTRITLSQNFITKIEKIERKQQQQEEERWYVNAHTTGYFIANSGYGLRKGESYYKNVWVLYNEFNIGITRNFSMSVSTLPLFLFAGAPTPVWVTPRVTVPLAKDVVNIGAGAVVGGLIGEGGGFMGLFYGNVTFGPRNKNLSVGGGYLVLGNESGTLPAVNVNGLLQVSRSTFLMMENYIFFSDGVEGIFSVFGGRTMIKKVALDYGLMLPFVQSQEVFFAIPWLGVTIPFKSRSK